MQVMEITWSHHFNQMSTMALVAHLYSMVKTFKHNSAKMVFKLTEMLYYLNRRVWASSWLVD